jgi:hypothetical protein
MGKICIDSQDSGGASTVTGEGNIDKQELKHQWFPIAYGTPSNGYRWHHRLSEQNVDMNVFECSICGAQIENPVAWCQDTVHEEGMPSCVDLLLKRVHES